MGDLPSVCMVTSSTDGWIPYDSGSWEEKVQKFIRTREMNLKISVPETRICRECEEARKPCGFNRTGNQTYCITRHHGELPILRPISLLYSIFLVWFVFSQNFAGQQNKKVKNQELQSICTLTI